VILVTGATGQVGGQAARDLIAARAPTGQADRAVTNSLETILGRLPRSLSEFLADHHGAVD
jgi:nucleoside-diphosphate-sugar epimerase